MKKNIGFTLIAAFALFAMSASAQTTSSTGVSSTGPIGGAKDSHGCLIAAGYTWDEAKKACVRPWETTARPGVPSTTGENNGYGVRTDMQQQPRVPGIRQGIFASTTAPIKAAKVELKIMRATTTDAIKAMRTDVREVRAGTKVEIKDMREEMKAAFASSTPEQIKELRAQFQEQAQALRASTTAMHTAMRDEAAKMRLEVALKHTDIMNARLTAAVDRIQTLAERTSAALDELAAKGTNVDQARAYLADAATKLDTGRTQAAAVKLAIETAFASENPKAALDAALPLVKQATTTLKEAHDLVAKAIAIARPGLNKPRE